MLISRTRVPPYLALVPICIGIFIAADDQTVVVTILPQIMRDMRLTVTELDRASWSITGYLLGYVVAMPLIGRLSDTWGYRRLFIASMAMFMLGSALVAVAPTFSWLLAARVFQAVGAGALVPVSIAMVGDLFPPGGRGVALGLIGASAEAGGVIGPLWGGVITRFLDWRWVFWINLPLGAATLIILVLLLGPGRRHIARVDYLGGGLIAVSLVLLTLGLARLGEPDWLMAVYLAGSGVSVAAFAARQVSAADPLSPRSMFRTLTFPAANLTHLAVGAALITGMVTIPLMANTVAGLSPLEGGLRLMRLTAAMPVGAILGGLACQRMDYRIPAVVGLLLAAAGFAFMSRWGADISDPIMTVHLATAGLGFGLLIAPIALAATESVREEDRGSAAGLVTAARMVGMTIGLAALTAWGTGHFQGLVAGVPLPFAMVGETDAETQQRVLEFEQTVTQAGLAVFRRFFLIAMAVSLVGIIPAAAMAWHRRRRPP